MSGQNDMKKTSNDFISVSISKVLSLVIAMAVSMFLSRYLSLSEYGTYSQLLTVTNLFTSLFVFGLPCCISYFIPRYTNEEEKRKFISTFYFLIFVVSLIMGLSFILSIGLISKYYKNDFIVKCVFFLALYPGTKIVTGTIENLLSTYGETKKLFFYRIIYSLVIIVLLILTYVIKLSFESYLIAYASIELSFSVFVYVLMHKYSSHSFSILDRKIIFEIAKYFIPIGLATMIGTLNIELDKLIIGKALDKESLAIYTNASKELPFSIITNAVTTIMLPIMSLCIKNNNNSLLLKKWHSAIIICFYIICFCSVGCFVYAEDVICLLYSSKYVVGVDIFRVHCFALILKSVYFGIILNASGKTKYLMYCSIILLMIHALLDFILINAFGIIGAAFASVISSFIMPIMQLNKSKEIINVTFKEILPWKRLGMIFLLNILFGLMLFVAKRYINLQVAFGSIIESIIIAIIIGFIYFLLIYKKLKTEFVKMNE